jgi:FKBP-type peptidyl-prolyl cis-trans isomerase SlyD
MNPRKRKARIREALQKAAEEANTEQEQALVERAASVALQVGKLTQEEVDQALASIHKENKQDGEKKQTTNKTTEETTKKRTTKKRTTKKSTTKKRTKKAKE